MRVVYAGVLAARAQDYVEAARAIGARPARIMLRTILPNIAGPVLVQVSLTAASAVVLKSACRSSAWAWYRRRRPGA